MPYIQKKQLFDFGIALLVKKGVPRNHARFIVETVITTEAFGISTHGVSFFPYAEANIPALINPKAEPVVVKEKGATAVIDGRHGFGHIAMQKAVELALSKAKAQGIAMIGVINCAWLGALGIHLISIARQGFFAQLWAQTNTCKDCAPIGGIDAKFSTNPVALAFPTGADPMVADFSTASVAMGKANQMIQRGEKAPEEIFMDRDGKFSADPKVVKEGGTILFTGGKNFGHKGYALSLWCEALTALAGGECNNPASKTAQSFNLLVIDPEGFAGMEAYLREIKRFIAHLKDNRRLPGVAAIRLPGERGFESLRQSESRGISLRQSMVDTLNKLAAKHSLVKLGA